MDVGVDSLSNQQQPVVWAGSEPIIVYLAVQYAVNGVKCLHPRVLFEDTSTAPR